MLIGSSGVGKSTLVNALLGAERQRTADVRDDGAGRHTTTHRELLELPGGAFLIDTPGMRELQLWSARRRIRVGVRRRRDAGRASAGFATARTSRSRGAPCVAAVERGALDADRLASWHKLRRELAYLERRQDAARRGARARDRAKSTMRLLRTHLRESTNSGCAISG